jgi:hypothetical protein
MRHAGVALRESRRAVRARSRLRVQRQLPGLRGLRTRRVRAARHRYSVPLRCRWHVQSTR